MWFAVLLLLLLLLLFSSLCIDCFYLLPAEGFIKYICQKETAWLSNKIALYLKALTFIIHM